MKERKVLENIVRYTLVFLLVLSFLCSIFISFINPESYFFGEKLSGGKAKIYLLLGGITGIIIAYLLLKKKNKGEILSVLYFGYFFMETLITNLSLGFGFLISPLSTIGLVISIILLMVRKRRCHKNV